MEILLNNLPEKSMYELSKRVYLDVIILDFNILKDEKSEKYFKTYDVKITSISPRTWLNGDTYLYAGKIQYLKDNKIKIKNDYTLKSDLINMDFNKASKFCTCETNTYSVLVGEVNSNVILFCNTCISKLIPPTIFKDLEGISNTIKKIQLPSDPCLNRYPLEKYIAYICQCVEKYGWNPDKESEDCTATISWGNMANDFDIEDKYFEYAKKVIKTIMGMGNKKESAFIKSLKFLIMKEVIHSKDKVLSSYVYKTAYDHLVDKNSDWLGKVGDVIEETVIFMGAKQQEGKFGNYFIYTFNYEGNKIYSFSSKVFDLISTQNYTLRAEILRHEEFNNKKSTKVKILTVRKLGEKL
jgi:hypothetical protein